MIVITRQELINLISNRAERLITKIVKEEHPEKTKQRYDGMVEAYYEIIEILDEVIIEEVI